LSIEKYYKKIEHYPKALKRLFEIGTHLLSQFDGFYSMWYGFQCEVQKFYNYIYSLEQELILSQLSNNFQLKQLEKVVLHYHNLNEEFLKIMACFNYFKVEIIAQNQVLFANTNRISTDCLRLFEKIGIMDF